VYTCALPGYGPSFPNIEGRAVVTWNAVHRIAGFTDEMLPYSDFLLWYFADGGGWYMSTCITSGVATRVCAGWRHQTDVAWKFAQEYWFRPCWLDAPDFSPWHGLSMDGFYFYFYTKQLDMCMQLFIKVVHTTVYLFSGMFHFKLNQSSKFIFGFGSTCVTRCKFWGAQPKL